jgi:hypothetical protein
MASLHTLDGDKLGDVTNVVFSDDDSEVGFVVYDLGTVTSFEESTSYRLETDDGDTYKVLPHSGEGDGTKRRWACYVLDGA